MLFRKKAKTPLWKGVAEFIFQNSSEACWAIEGAVICDCNPTAEKILGVPRDNIIGMPPEAFSPERQPDGRRSSEAAAEAIAAAMTHGSQRFEWTHQRPDGTPLPMEVTLMRASIDGRTLLIASLSDRRDAAALRRAEQDAATQAAEAQRQRQSLDMLAGALSGLAGGDLTGSLEGALGGDFASVRDDFNAAARKLAQVLREISRSTQNIRSGSQEVSTAADDLSQRTERQAASLEETAAAIGQITQTLKTSAEGARRAAEVVATADGDAKDGAVVAKRAVEAMDAIAQSSEQIGQIIGVIDEIAFQTNLLALNAGVEAARAGEAGRGFAVVAMEVRGLAQRSALAANEIKALISTSGAQVVTGVKLVADTGKALERIIAQVSEINSAVAGIASGAREQSTALQEINAAIGEMDQSTQQNATMVGQTTAASHALWEEAQRLGDLLTPFRFGAVAAPVRAEPKRAPPLSKPARLAVKSVPRAARPPALAASGAARGASHDWSEF